jgi:3D (Asp-Asp-Asp) domain-containing protein/LysM repeat protein
MKKSILTGLLAITACVGAASSAAAAEAYKVKENDSFWKIEKAHKLPTQSLQAINPNIDPLNLQIGSIIKMPDTYTAKEGETLWTISKEIKIPVEKLQNLNPKVNPQNIQGGTVLVLPDKESGQAKKEQKVEAAKSKVSTVSTKAKKVKKAAKTVKTTSGNELNYSHVISSKATAYSGAAEENGGYAGVDYFGNKLKVGTIAVDPDVIPLGSKVYVTGYSSFPGLPKGGMIARATDIGGAIKDKHIDIYVPGSPDHVNDFGVQKVKVYILK